jgi:hypothetical protein
MSIHNLRRTKTKTQAVADAFKTVSSSDGYRDRWIQDSDYAAIIRLEYSVQSDHLLTPNVLNKSLSRDKRFKAASDTTLGNGNGTFRDAYEPRKHHDGSDNYRGKIHCYFVTDAGKFPPETSDGTPWFETIIYLRVDCKST